MAHFAQLDDNDTVTQVIVVNNTELIDENGNESEVRGIDFCVAHFGGRWVQTSYNSKIRKNYAGSGYKYDRTNDAFIPPQPYPSWVLNTTSFRWDAPVPYPTDGKLYTWDEPTKTWVEVK
jgi:hypothetical protein